MDKKLLDILVCPVTGAPVTLADAELLAQANRRIAAGDLRHSDGSPVEDALSGALVTRDGGTLYAIHDGIPMMLPERGIEWSPAA
ncbi:Trm112 family protein [Salinisphaera sp. T31B1]|uniref:Trm112 family protein n=1 Tax=Salinisphaera sp. T31B1 TaxID=727963 RepID=UPI00334121F8